MSDGVNERISCILSCINCNCNCHVFGDGFCVQCAGTHFAERTRLSSNVTNHICRFCESFVSEKRISHLRSTQNFKGKSFIGIVNRYYR